MQDENIEREENAPENQVYATRDEIQAMKGMIADLRQDNVKLQATSQLLRSEISSMKRDLTGMNEVLRNLLSIYDVVCKDYNPFVDDSVSVVKVESDQTNEGEQNRE